MNENDLVRVLSMRGSGESKLDVSVDNANHESTELENGSGLP
jgi:hypothetical protein